VPDVHLPHLDDEDEADGGPPSDARAAGDLERPDTRRRSKSLLKIGLEVLLIGTGVFLGLMGEQWREHAQHRELAETSLRRFREEILTNRNAVTSVKDYHVTTKQKLDAFLAADAKLRPAMFESLRLKGIQPASFERTAWDLALVTQALTYVDPPLAFSLSRIYTTQAQYAELSRGVLQAMYVITPMNENPIPFFSAVAVYYGDIVLYEPKLLTMYDEVLPQIDRALGESSAERPR